MVVSLINEMTGSEKNVAATPSSVTASSYD
jgi:hypothetical protein